jgi:diacylglycerol O-acyltransferase / trehalose O-mycolyltransferase
MDYAAREPGFFRAAASFSGVLHPLADADYWTGLFSQYASSDVVWGDPDADRGVWEAHDPTSLAPRLRGTKLFVASGDGADRDATERVVGRESRQFVARLHALKIAVTTDLYRGGRHDWPYWQRDLHRALPLLLGALGT